MGLCEMWEQMCVCHECTCECKLTKLCVYLCVSMQNMVNVGKCVCVCVCVCLLTWV